MLLVQRVSAWIRDNSDVMQVFMDKCRRIIKISRSLHAPVEPTLLQQEIPQDLWFTRNDRRIIEYIAGYVTGRRGFATDDLLSLTPMLIKRLGMYGPDITPEPDRNAARLLLTEIGAWQPSENVAMHTEAAMITQQIYQPRKAIDLYLTDNLAEFRHDFGTQTVLVIDDASAHELDDGISMETTSEGTWLHVHIANPSAFFGPTSQIAKMARLRQTSLYLPDTTYRMFPSIGSGGDGFSRGASETPTMTFSARLGGDGNIIDFKVRPGIVRNVKIMTYADVDSKVFSAAKIPERAWWTAAYSAPRHEEKEFDQISDDTRSQILSMASVVKAHREWRVRNGALNFDLPSANINVSPAPLKLETSHPPSPQDPMQILSEYTIPTFVRGYAGVKVSIGSRRSPASALIEEMMIIAGRIAGLAARENKLPVAYRGLSAPIPQDLLQRCYDLHRSGEKCLPPDLSRRVISTSGTWDLRLSPKPLSHELLGIPAKEGGYVQVSSPLRRYLDVLAHWQFEAFFKQTLLPFTFDQLSGTQELSLHQAQRRIFRRILFTRQVNRFYATHALTQYLRDPSGIGSTHLEMENGMFKLTGIYLETGMMGAAVAIPRLINIPELGITGAVQLGPGQRWPPFGTQFPVEIDKVDEIFGITMFRLAK
jgi:exoribonuclease II